MESFKSKMKIDDEGPIFDERSFNQIVRKEIMDSTKACEDALGGKVGDEFLERLIALTQKNFKATRDLAEQFRASFCDAGESYMELLREVVGGSGSEADVDRAMQSNDQCCKAAMIAERLHKHLSVMLMQSIASSVDLGMQMGDITPPGAPQFLDSLQRTLEVVMKQDRGSIRDFLRKVKEESERGFQ